MQSDPVESLKNLKKQGRRLVGCFPLYPPVELFHSLGLIPLTLWGRGLSGLTIDVSYNHLQTYACSVAHRLTEFLLSEPGKKLDGIFGYNACDTLRNLREIVSLALGESGPPFFGFHLPQTPRDQTDAAAYFRNELRSLIDGLEETFGVEFTENAFQDSVELYRRARMLITRLEQSLPFTRFAEAVEESHLLPVEEQIEFFESLAGVYPGEAGGRVIVSGILTPPAPVLEIIGKSGLRVVGNDLATLARSNYYTPEKFESVFDYYRDFYDNHHPCTTLLHTADSRIQFLNQLLDNTKAQGFIFLGEKFCEHEYFEIPSLERLLKERGLPVLQLEFSLDDDRMAESIRTRIEAFAEIVNG